MKKYILAAIAATLLCVSAQAQNFNSSYNFVAKGTQGPGASFANTGVTAFAITWTPTSTVNSCAVQVDSSADNVTWGSADLVASQNCAVAGSVAYATLASGKNFVRVNVTSIVGNGGLNVTLIGSSGSSSSSIASGTAVMGTSAISSGACATVVTVAAAAVGTTNVIVAGFNGDPTAVTGYGASATGAVLTIYSYPTAGNVNFKVCNSSSGSITPGALTLNWKAF